MAGERKVFFSTLKLNFHFCVFKNTFKNYSGNKLFTLDTYLLQFCVGSWDAPDPAGAGVLEAQIIAPISLRNKANT